MIFKRVIFMVVFCILFTDAKFRFGRRRSTITSSNESSTSPVPAILGFGFLISLCGCKIYRCRQKRQHRQRVQQQMNNLADIHKQLMQISTVDQFSSDRSNTVQLIWMPLSVQSFTNVSEKLINRNELEQTEVQDSICPQQTTHKEEKQLAIVPIEVVKVSSGTN